MQKFYILAPMENNILNSNFFKGPIIRVPEGGVDSAKGVGSNQKNLIIVSMDEQSPDAGFLKKVFESVDVFPERDALLFVTTQNTDFSWNGLKKTVEFDQLVFFGTDPSQIGLHFEVEWYQPFDFQNRQLMMAEPLGIIAADRSRKAALWKGLKEMFVTKPENQSP